MMKAITDPALRSFVVWVPKRSGKEKDVPVATRLMPDDRAAHFWDENGAVMQAYTKVLALPVDAWDIYFLYGPEARWDSDVPPKPHFWMHQLGGLPGEMAALHLDSRVFADSVRSLLRRGR